MDFLASYMSVRVSRLALEDCKDLLLLLRLL